MLKKNSPLLLAELRTFAPYTSIHFSKRQSDSLTHYYIFQVIWTLPLHWNYSLSMSVRTKFYLFSLSFAILQTIQWPLPHFKNYFSHRFCSLSTTLKHLLWLLFPLQWLKCSQLTKVLYPLSFYSLLPSQASLPILMVSNSTSMLITKYLSSTVTHLLNSRRGF